MANLIIPDVSTYQDDNTTPLGINFAAMKATTPGVFIRAGQGNWVDADWTYNWSVSRAAGMARGSYWFYDSRYAPKIQAQKYILTLGNDLGQLPLVLDLEEAYKGPFQGWRCWYDCLSEMRRLAPGKEIMIYTGYYYWTERIPPPTSVQWFSQFPLWIASYNPAPQIPSPWREWLFWQYTDKGDGKPYGVESLNIDLNYFNGDQAAFNTRFGIAGATGPLPPEPPAPDKIKTVTVTYESGRVVTL